MIGVAAAAAILTVAYHLVNAPMLNRWPAVTITVLWITFGIVLPSLWIGATRRLSVEGLLVHIAGVCLLLVGLFSAQGKPGVFFAFLGVALGALLLGPSLAWYLVTIARPGAARDRLRSWTLYYTKSSFHIFFVFFLFLLPRFLLG